MKKELIKTKKNIGKLFQTKYETKRNKIWIMTKFIIFKKINSKFVKYFKGPKNLEENIKVEFSKPVMK